MNNLKNGIIRRLGSSSSPIIGELAAKAERCPSTTKLVGFQFDFEVYRSV